MFVGDRNEGFHINRRPSNCQTDWSAVERHRDWILGGRSNQVPFCYLARRVGGVPLSGLFLLGLVTVEVRQVRSLFHSRIPGAEVAEHGFCAFTRPASQQCPGLNDGEGKGVFVACAIEEPIDWSMGC